MTKVKAIICTLLLMVLVIGVIIQCSHITGINQINLATLILSCFGTLYIIELIGKFCGWLLKDTTDNKEKDKETK